jgi:hypothetical protein
MKCDLYLVAEMGQEKALIDGNDSAAVDYA